MRFCTILLFCIFGTAVSYAQDGIPKVEGTLKLSLKKGIIDCSFTLSNLPNVDSAAILINSGMNIRYLRNPVDKQPYAYGRTFDSNTSEESFIYFLPDNSGAKHFLPSAIQVSYVGAFPVYTDSLEGPSPDWRGNIAFNRNTVRADGLQSNWYPLLYDIKAQKYYEKVNVQVKVECEDCSSIFLNGNKVVKGHNALFSNSSASELILFAGDYFVYEKSGNFYLNFTKHDNRDKVDSLFAATDRIKRFYERNIGIEYGGNVNFINAKRASQRTGFGFFSYPTVIFVNEEAQNIADLAAKGNGFLCSVAHELGHYYFGELKQMNTCFGRAASEAFTEYISLQAIRSMVGDSVFRGLVCEKLLETKEKTMMPLRAISSYSNFENGYYLYAYSLMPIVLLAIEKEIGPESMWEWVKAVVQTSSGKPDYDLVLNALESTLNDPLVFNRLKQHYFEADDAFLFARGRIEGL